MMKTTAAKRDRKSVFGIWCRRGYLHMIPVNLQIIMDDPDDFLPLSPRIPPSRCDRLTKR